MQRYCNNMNNEDKEKILKYLIRYKCLLMLLCPVPTKESLSTYHDIFFELDILIERLKNDKEF